MKKNLIIAFLALSSFFFTCNRYSMSQTVDDELKLYMGTNETISVSNPTRIAIGNPSIADVAQVSKKDMTIVPKAVGTTTFVYWDNFGEQSYVIKVFSEKTEEIKTRVDSALARLNITDAYTKAEDEEGKVFILGKFRDAGERERFLLGIAPLKDKVVDLTTIKEDEAVVEIDVQVLELQKGSSEKLGFTWPSSMTITELASTATTGTTWGKLFTLGNVSRAVFDLTLDALCKTGKARVLSRPRLSCLSGKEAKLLVGGEVPILSATVTGGGTSGTTPTPGNV